ncbi:MAG: Hsp20/alpha crystallin family protein, partial [Nitrospinota bacterium]
ELSGIKRDDITIEVNENILFLKGHRAFLHDIREENYYRMERSYGTFQRNFNLPNNIAQDEVGAVFKDGILEIRLPKVKSGDPNVIKVCVE